MINIKSLKTIIFLGPILGVREHCPFLSLLHIYPTYARRRFTLRHLSRNGHYDMSVILFY